MGWYHLVLISVAHLVVRFGAWPNLDVFGSCTLSKIAQIVRQSLGPQSGCVPWQITCTSSTWKNILLYDLPFVVGTSREWCYATIRWSFFDTIEWITQGAWWGSATDQAFPQPGDNASQKRSWFHTGRHPLPWFPSPGRSRSCRGTPMPKCWSRRPSRGPSVSHPHGRLLRLAVSHGGLPCEIRRLERCHAASHRTPRLHWPSILGAGQGHRCHDGDGSAGAGSATDAATSTATSWGRHHLAFAKGEGGRLFAGEDVGLFEGEDVGHFSNPTGRESLGRWE